MPSKQWFPDGSSDEDGFYADSVTSQSAWGRSRFHCDPGPGMLSEPRRSQQQQQQQQRSTHEDGHQSSSNGRRQPNGQVLSNGHHQTAWQNSYNRPPSRHNQQHSHHHHQQHQQQQQHVHQHHQHQGPPRRPSSPSDETSSSSDDREEMARSLVRRPGPGHANKHWAPGAGHDFRGTLRSTRSVPALALATWDGEPCPVHGHGPAAFYPPAHGHPPPPATPQGMHPPPPMSAQATMRRFGSMFDVRPGFYPLTALDRKSMHGSMSVLNVPPPPPPVLPPVGGPPLPPMGPPPFLPPPHLMPPMMRPRPYVYPAEPLPTRDPYRSKTPVLQAPKMEQDYYSVDQVCCKGHLIVLWIILAVVTIGVILGIILGVTVT